MAILKSIITEGAKGSMGNVTLRQVCGQTVASQKRIGRAYSKLSTQQKEQCSAFKWAVKCLQYAPLYPQIAFARLETKSGYNRCVGLIVDAVKKLGIPGEVGFPNLVDIMADDECQVALGLPTRGSIEWQAGAGSQLTAFFEGFQEDDVCHVWWCKDDETRARYENTIVDDSEEAVIHLSNPTKAIAVVTHEAIPYTFDSSAIFQ